MTVLLLLVLGAAGCGSQTAPGATTTRPAASPSGTLTGAGDRELIGAGTVLEDASHGPQLCLGGMRTSLPPQCGGPDIPNWDWDTVEGHQTNGATTWGGYVVVGRYDDAARTFTPTRPATSQELYTGPPMEDPEDPVLRSPCPEPDGGWQVLDPATTTDGALQETAARAADMPGYAGLWVDQSRSSNPGQNDPTQLVLNAAFTHDLDARERDLRATWGGALCVSKAPRTEAELRDVQRALTEEPGILETYGDPTGTRVRMRVVHDDGTLQRRLDAEYGPGVVVVTSALRPYAGELRTGG